MRTSQEPSRSELLAEIDRLRAEVKRFHDLMGLANRTGDEHRHAWAPTLFDGSQARKSRLGVLGQAEKQAGGVWSPVREVRA